MKSSNSLLALLMAMTLIFGSCATAHNPNIPDANGTGPRKTGMSKTAKGGIIGAGGGA